MNFDYYKVLFKPGHSLQARELNELQSILLSQNGALSNHIFKNGSKVNGCTTAFVQYDYVTIENVNDDFTNMKLISHVSGVEATVVYTNGDKLLLIYTRSGTDKIKSVFENEESISIYNSSDELLKTIDVKSTGKCLIFTIDEGIFYYNGYFVNVDKQFIVVEDDLKKDSIGNIISPLTYRVGLDVIQSIVTSDDDPSLLDPHHGANNFGAPGADRLKIELLLSIRDYVENDYSNFILLAKVRQNHTVEYKKEDTNYNEIMKELARRTYESFGDFTVNPWKVQLFNEKKKSDVDNKGWSSIGKDSNYVLLISPGSGYIKGNRVETISDMVVRSEKARDTIKTTYNIPLSKFPVIETTELTSYVYNTGDAFEIKDGSDETIATFNLVSIIKLQNKTGLYIKDLSILPGKNILNGKKVVGSNITGNIIDITKATINPDLINLGIKEVEKIENANIGIPLNVNQTIGPDGKIILNNDVQKSVGSYCLVDGIHTNPSITYGNPCTIDFGQASAGKTAFISVTEHQLMDFGLFETDIYTKTFTGPSERMTLDHPEVQRLETVILERNGVKTDLTVEYGIEYPNILTRNGSRLLYNTDKLIVTYHYLTREPKKIFSANSYVNSGIPHEDIPMMDGSSMGDWIDVSDSDIIVDPRGSILTDVEHYLPRKDLLLVNKDGQFYIKNGISSVNPALPYPDEDTIALYEIHLDAFTHTLNDISTKYIPNKVYTSKDISNLEQRVENVEDAVTLSLLEKNTIDMSIKDVDGFDRFKNGILVDNFKGYYAADVGHHEFKASLDRNKGELRPQFKQSNLKLEINKAITKNVKFFGNVGIADFQDDLFISNKNATQTLSINPYMIFRKMGNLKLSPNVDTWADTDHLPNIVSDIDTGVEALKEIADAQKLLGTDYGSWVDFNTSTISNSKTSISITPSPNSLLKNVVNVNNKTTTTTITESSRNKTSTEIKSNKNTYTLNDIVKDVSIIPYIRPTTIQFYATNMKPNTRLYAYFDGQDVSKHCKAMAQLEKNGEIIVNRSMAIFGDRPLITDNNGNLSGEFRIPPETFFTGEKVFVLTNDSTNSGNPDIETSRCENTYFAGGISQDKQSHTMNIITPSYSTSSSTEYNKVSTSVSRETNISSIVDRELDDTVDMNTVKEYFYKNHPFYTRECKVCNVGATWAGLTYSETGSTHDRFMAKMEATKNHIDAMEQRIIQTEALNEKSIEAEWKTFESITPAFKALEEIKKRFEEHRQRCKKSYDNFFEATAYKEYVEKYNQAEVDEWKARFNANNGFVQDMIRRILSKDPIAQGFKVEESCFISKIGVYFSDVDDKTDLIWFEIREMVNGYPSSESIARHEVSGADLNIYKSSDMSKEYHVVFPAPVYVDSSKSYAFVIGGYSPDTRVYISKLGEKLLSSDKILEEPPLTYTMFRSLNGETWNAEQLTTLVFNMYRCVFNTSDMEISFNVNTSLIEMNLMDNPIEVQPNSNRVRIYANNHGLRTNDRVILSFDSGKYYRMEVTAGMPQIGQPISTSTGSAYIEDIKLTDTLGIYEISLKKSIGIFKEGQEFYCETRSVQYRDLSLISDTGISGAPIVQHESSGIIKSIPDYMNIKIGGMGLDIYSKEHIVREVDSIDSFIVEIESSFKNIEKGGSDNVKLFDNNVKYDMINVSGQHLTYGSPCKWTLKYIDCETNEFHDPIEFYHGSDTYLEYPSVILSDRNEKRILGKDTKSMSVTATLKMVNPYISPVFNLDSFSSTLISNRIESIDKVVYNKLPSDNRYYDETDASKGSESYKYVTTKVLLENPAVDAKVMFDVHCSNVSDFDVYIKLISLSNKDEDKIKWTHIDKYTKKYTGVDNNDFISYSLTCSDNCSTWNNNYEFSGFRVKLVGKSKKSTRPVIFKNLRIIAIT